MMADREVTQHRRSASPERIRAIIKACQSCGLEPTSLTHHPDGRTTIAFTDGREVEMKPAYKPRGWIIK